MVFDGDCGFCTTSASWVARRLEREASPDARLVPWQRADVEALGSTTERAQREVLWVEVDGTVLGGADAVAAWLRYAGGSAAALGRLLGRPGVRHLARLGYRLIAANRQWLPGGTPACALPPGPPPRP